VTAGLPPEAGQLWEAHAAWWAEGFTAGADPEYTEQILPLAAAHLAGATRVVDVGCGEGQVSRLAASLPGVELVAGVDPTWAQLRLAARRAGGGAGADGGAAAPVGLARGDAAGLPFAAGAFDAAVACLVLEHVCDAGAALSEVGRVLAPGGRFVLMLNHPLLQAPGSGWIDDTILDEQYWRIGSYLVEDHVVEEVAKDVWIPFVHRPLSRYVNALADAGLFVTRMEEPAPPPGFLARAAEYREAATIPRLLLLRAEKLAAGGRR
jgi:SAM-dependent methyltransferase